MLPTRFSEEPTTLRAFNSEDLCNAGVDTAGLMGDPKFLDPKSQGYGSTCERPT